MSRVSKAVPLTAVTALMIDLRAEGDTTSPFNEVGHLKLKFWSNADGAEILAVKPIVVEQGSTVPSPSAYPSFAAHGLAADVVLMTATTLAASGVLQQTEVELGVPFAKGYDSDVYGAPLATHLSVAMKSTGDCFLTIEGR